MEAEEAEAGGGFFEDGGVEGGGLFVVIDELDDCSGADAFTGFEHDPPFEGRGFLGEEDFDVTAGVLFAGAEAGGDDAAIIEDEEVAGQEEAGEVEECAMAGASGLSIEGKQAGAIPFICGMLSDEFRGQWIVEVFDEHAGIMAGKMGVIKTLAWIGGCGHKEGNYVQICVGGADDRCAVVDLCDGVGVVGSRGKSGGKDGGDGGFSGFGGLRIGAGV
ncbi:MAG: hypothetical protein RI897_4567 [Verrucomicrobiota bacterium]|jgi:hypothetical protein